MSFSRNKYNFKLKVKKLKIFSFYLFFNYQNILIHVSYVEI